MKTDFLTIVAVLAQLVFNRSASAHLEQAKLLASDANADDRLGVSVAIDGQTAVVGAYQADSNGLDSGAAYVFESIDSNWVQQQKLVASDASAGDQFGRSVAILADTIVVGAYLDDNNCPDAGSVYVFTRSGSVWSQQQKLAASDPHPRHKFGFSLAIDNNFIVIGAPGDDSYIGAAYVFARDGQTWTQRQKLTPSDANLADNFGCSVVIDANIIIAGASMSDHSGFFNAGYAYQFSYDGLSWTQSQILRASDPNDADLFGASVALDADVAVVGAYECDVNGVINAGAAYVFDKTDTSWVEKQKLFDVDTPNPGDDFGRAVAVETNAIFVGVPNHLVDGFQSGAVFEFALAGQTWVQNRLIIPADVNSGDSFGFSISVSGPHLVAGAHFSDPNGASAGSAYVFQNNALAGDLDNDADVDFADFAVFALAWLAAWPQPAYDPACDIAIPPDELINSLDLAVLCNNWLAGK